MRTLTLYEELERMKSLFTEERLYGNSIINENKILLTEGGRFGWLDDVIGFIDDAHVGSAKWGDFSMIIKNSDDFIENIKTSPFTLKFTDELFPNWVTKNLDNIVEKGKTLDDNPTFLSDSFIDNTKRTLRENGADLSKRIEYNGVSKSIEEHIDNIYQNSTAKSKFDDLQKQIEIRMESPLSLDTNTPTEEIFDAVRGPYKSEIEALGEPNVIDLSIKKVNDFRAGKDGDQLAAIQKLIKDTAEKAYKTKIQNIHNNYMVLYGKWKQKYKTKLGLLFGAKYSGKVPEWAENIIDVWSTLLAKIKSFELQYPNRIIRVLGSDESDTLWLLLNKTTIHDYFIGWPGRAAHLLKQGRHGPVMKEMGKYYRLLYMGTSYLLTSTFWQFLTDVVRIIFLWVTGGAIELDNTKRIFYKKRDALIWNFGRDILSKECYELLGEKEYEKTGNYTKFINKMNKEDYTNYVKRLKIKYGDDYWPTDFCKYFVCAEQEVLAKVIDAEGREIKEMVKKNLPLRVNCEKYGFGYKKLKDQGGTTGEIVQQELMEIDDMAHDVMNMADTTINNIYVQGQELKQKSVEKGKEKANQFKGEIENMEWDKLPNDIKEKLVEELKKTTEEAAEATTEIYNTEGDF